MRGCAPTHPERFCGRSCLSLFRCLFADSHAFPKVFQKVAKSVRESLPIGCGWITLGYFPFVLLSTTFLIVKELQRNMEIVF